MKNYKIAVTSDSFSFNSELTSRLRSYFPSSIFKPHKNKFSKAELIEFIQGCDGVIVGLEKMDKEVIDAVPNLRIISKYGVGTDNLDLDYMREKNIRLGWSPGLNKNSVSELVICQMINMTRNVYSTSLSLRSGVWNKDGGRELSELKVGILGTGHIGKEVIKKLTVFGSTIIAYDQLDMEDFYSQHQVRKVGLEELFQSSDIISVHVPLSDETNGFIGERLLGMMKPDAMIINTARGGIIDEEALYIALTAKKIRGASLDVYTVEPAVSNKLLTLENFIPTPHIAGNSRRAVMDMGNSAIDHLVGFFGVMK
jgi:phosphoglycerate dehydrogenase-like enzyme